MRSCSISDGGPGWPHSRDDLLCNVKGATQTLRKILPKRVPGREERAPHACKKRVCGSWSPTEGFTPTAEVNCCRTDVHQLNEAQRWGVPAVGTARSRIPSGGAAPLGRWTFFTCGLKRNVLIVRVVVGYHTIPL